MRRVINNIISILYTIIKFGCMKLFLGERFCFHVVERFSPNVVTEFNEGSYVTLGDKVRVHSGTKIKARKNAKLYIGANVKVNYNCIIACHNEIWIGDGTEFGPSVYLYDHDHDYRSGLKNNKYISEPIHIGKNCWIGANTVLLRGTVLGDNCVVGAGCVLRGKYESGSVIVQKRVTTVNGEAQ